MSNQEKEILEENTVTEEAVDTAEETTDAVAEETVEAAETEAENADEEATQEKDKKFGKKKKTVDIMLDFFVKDGEVYTRYSEEFSEKAYTNEELGAALEKAGLQIVEIFDDMTEKAVNNESQRAIYVTKKVE